MRAPKVFISYSWDDKEHRDWVHDLATRLRNDGVDVELDQWAVHLGDPLPEFMERSVRDNDFVLVICTPKYKQRSDDRVGGVGYEGDIMTAQVYATRDHRKFIPVLSRGGWSSAFPSWLSGKAGVDFRTESRFEIQYKTLIDTLHGQTPQPPPLGPRPDGPSEEPAAETEPGIVISPGIRPGQLPPFHELDEYTFQDLCRDLFDTEPSVATCEVYGIRGQAQYGIDMLARTVDAGGTEVGQCKCYETFTLRQIERVREEFFEHYGERWRPQNVKRFILFVAADLSSTHVQDKISEEGELFAAFGIRYEVWSAAQIRNKLRPHPEIVATYLRPAEYWVMEICGRNLPVAQTTPAAQTSTTTRVNAVLLERLERLGSEEAERRLKDMRAAWYEGKRGQAVALLDALKAETATWGSVSSEAKAKVLRFEASVRLHISGDVGWAKRLADEAHELSPTDDETRVRALIARAEDGAGAAAQLLAGKRDTDSVNLRASLLLEEGDFEGFREVLKTLPEQEEPNAESTHLRAIAYLLDREVDRATLEAEKAIELAPEWESIRLTAGVANYVGTLPPAALPSYLVEWPEPVDWSLVRRDEESLARLRGAAEIFRALAEDVEDKDNRQRYETWLLACLANDPERQEEAAVYCRRLLEDEPTHHRAILWAVARSIAVDLTASESMLREMVRDQSATMPHTLALSALLLADDRPREAADLLDGVRSLFEADGATSLWTYWHVQSLALAGDPQAAVEELDASDAGGELRRIRTVVLGTRAEQTGDWSKVLEHLEESYKETADPRFLFDACEIKESQGDYAYVADRAHRLVDELRTADALRLAAVGAYNDDRFELCMRLLDDNRDVLSGGKLSRELRQVRLGCQHRLGLLPDASQEAERLYSEEPTVANGLNLLVVRLSLGDRPGSVLAARQLAERGGLTDAQALGIAEIMRLDDPDLARALWRGVVHKGVPDELVSRALNLGFGLGLESEVRALTARAMELANRGEGGLQAMNLQEALEFFEERRESFEAFQQLYLDGTAPIHFAPEAVGGMLSSAFHRTLLENESAGAPADTPFLLTAYGNRSSFEVPEDALTGGRLILDSTAVLLAEHLDMLDEVEEAFEELHVPHELVQALARMRDQAFPHQPARQDVLENVVRLADQGKLREATVDLPAGYENTLLMEEMGENWVAALERVREQEGYLVDFLPLTTKTGLESPTTLPDYANAHLVNAGSVVEALRISGPISETRAAGSREALGVEGRTYPDHPVPGAGSYLFLDSGIAELLAGARLLEAACDRFEVYIQKQQLSQFRAELRDFGMALDDAEWLEGLIDRLRRGLESGVYGTVVAPEDEAQDSLRDSDDPTIHCLDTVLRFEPCEGDVIWIDDRAVNKYRSRNGVPTVGVYDILRVLRASGKIREERYYSALIKLRSANVRFLPVDSEEILYHLRQARVENNEVVETTELRTLRRYGAACLMRGDVLRRPVAQNDGVVADVGEMPFILQLSRAVTEALTRPWGDARNAETERARTEWLLANMYLGYAGLTNVLDLPGSGEDERPKVAFDLRDLIIRAIAVPSATPGERAARSRSLSWLEQRVLGKRFDADPELLPLTAAEVKDSILEVRQEVSGQAPEPEVNTSFGTLYEDLPPSIHDELSRDPDFMAAIGLKRVFVMQVGPYRFGSEKFWDAAEEAINGRTATISTVGDDSATVSLRATEDLDALILLDPTRTEDPTVTTPYLPLLSESAAIREDALRRNRAWFDCEDSKFEAALAEIASAKDSSRRLEEAEWWHDSSATVFYDEVPEKLVGQESLFLNDFLLPDVGRLLDHLRLKGETVSGSAFAAEAARAAEQLVQEEGVETALRRFAGLPVPLPDALISAGRALPAEEQHAMVQRLVATSGSPVSKVHLIRLLICLDGSTVYARLAARIARTLLDEKGAEEYGAFSALLGWVSDEFDFRPDAKTLSAHLRLAAVWYHAHRLFTIFASAGVPLEHTRDTFDQPDKRVTSEVFEREPEYWQDVCHPRRTDRVTFVHMGLAYAFGSETQHLDVAALQRVGGNDRAIQLLRDPNRARDDLASFMGVDRGEALRDLLTEEEADTIAASSLNELLAMAVDQLSEEDEQRQKWAWAIIFYVAGDQPLPDALQQSARDALSSADLAGFIRRDPPFGLAALRTASLQAFNLGGDSLLSHLREELIVSAEHFANNMAREGRTEIDVRASEDQIELRSLLDSAVHVSAAAGGDQAFADFAELLSRLTDAWPPAAPFCKLVVLRLCEELESPKTKPFWGLLNRLRAQ